MDAHYSKNVSGWGHWSIFLIEERLAYLIVLQGTVLTTICLDTSFMLICQGMPIGLHPNIESSEFWVGNSVKRAIYTHMPSSEYLVVPKPSGRAIIEKGQEHSFTQRESSKLPSFLTLSFFAINWVEHGMSGKGEGRKELDECNEWTL